MKGRLICNCCRFAAGFGRKRMACSLTNRRQRFLKWKVGEKRPWSMYMRLLDSLIFDHPFWLCLPFSEVCSSPHNLWALKNRSRSDIGLLFTDTLLYQYLEDRKRIIALQPTLLILRYFSLERPCSLSFADSWHLLREKFEVEDGAGKVAFSRFYYHSF